MKSGRGFLKKWHPGISKKGDFLAPLGGAPTFQGGPKKQFWGPGLKHFFMMFSKSLTKVEKLIKPCKNTGKMKVSDVRK